MSSFGNKVHKIIFSLFFTGTTVQILGGFVWMCANLGGYQEFEVGGILYPLLISLAGVVEGMTAVPYYCILYVVQVCTAGFSYVRFLQAITCKVNAKGQSGLGKWQAMWGSLCLLTIPVGMQCHLAVLPVSLTVSAFMLLLAGLFRLLDLTAAQESVQDYKKILFFSLLKIGCLLLICTLLMPEYRYLAGVTVGMAGIGVWIQSGKLKGLSAVQRYKQTGVILIALLFSILISFGLAEGVLGEKMGTTAKTQVSEVKSAMVSRFIWPGFRRHYSAWPGEIMLVMDENMAWGISLYADQVRSELIPAVEAAYGVEKAEALLSEMISAAFMIRKRDIAGMILQDLVSYTVSPLMLPRLLSGECHASYSGQNYEIMKNHTPGLTRYYVSYGCWWFGIVLKLALLLCLGKRGKSGGKWLLLSVTAVCMVCFYTMRGAGMMDYKNTILVTMLWYAGVIYKLHTAKSWGKEEMYE